MSFYVFKVLSILSHGGACYKCCNTI